MADAEYYRRWRAARKKAGLCARCGGKAPCGCSYASVKNWRKNHPADYRQESAETMRRRRQRITTDYVVGLLRNMGFTEFPPELIATEKLRLRALRAAGLNQKKK